MAEFKLSRVAQRDLEGIWRYSFEQWGADQAQRYVRALNAVFEELARAPTMAPACDHIRAGYRRRSFERHMIYFRIVGSGIVIVRVLHTRMDAGRHL